MVGHLVFAKENKHFLYGYVPKNWKSWRRGYLIFRKLRYSQQWTCSETSKQDMRNKCITATYRKRHNLHKWLTVHDKADWFIYQHNKLLVLNATPKMYLHTKPYMQNADSVWSKPCECLTLYYHPQCTVVTSSSWYAAGLEVLYVYECTYGSYTFKTPPPWAAVET
jgi:hypothetical protein